MLGTFALILAAAAPGGSSARLYEEAVAVMDSDKSAASNDEAEEKLRAIIASEPKFTAAYLGMARVTWRRGYRGGSDFDPGTSEAAHAWVDKALVIEPRSVDALLMKSKICIDQKNLEGARAWLEKARAIGGNTTETLQQAADLENFAGDPDAALRDAKAALAMARPSTRKKLLVDARSIVIRAAQKKGDAVAEDESHRALIDLDPSNAWARGNYSAFLTRQGRFDEAIRLAKQAISIMDYPAAHRALASACLEKAYGLWRQNKSAEAEPLFVEALKEDPTSINHYDGLANCYRSQAIAAKDPALLDKADEVLKRGLAMDPKFEQARMDLVRNQELRKSFK